MFDMANDYGDPSKWKESKKKPTEAFTTKGTAAKGLAKSKAKNRFSSDAKTKVKSATDAFAGGGTPLGASMAVNPISKGQIAGAVGSAVGGAVLGRAIGKAATGPVSNVISKAESKAFDKITKNYKFDSPTNSLSKSESKTFNDLTKPMDKARMQKMKSDASYKNLNAKIAKNANPSNARILAEQFAAPAAVAAGTTGGIIGITKKIDSDNAKIQKRGRQRQQITSNIPSTKFPKK